MSRTQAFLWLMKWRGNIWPIFVTDSKRQRQNQMFSTIRCKLKWKLLSENAFMPSIKSASDSQLAVDFLNIYFKFVSLFINFKKKKSFSNVCDSKLLKVDYRYRRRRRYEYVRNITKPDRASSSLSGW